MRPRNTTDNSSSSSSSLPTNLDPTFFNPHPTCPSMASLLPAHHQCMATLNFQNSYASSLVLAGDFLFAGSSDREIHIWKCSALSSPSGGEDDDHNMVVAGNGGVKALVVSSDKLISAHQDHKIRVWKIDADSQKFLTHLATLPTLSDRALKLLVPKNHVQVRRHKKQTWIHHVDTVSALALSGDESLLYSVSWDRTLKIWSASDFRCLESVANAHDDAINDVAVSDDGHVYTGSSDGKIKVWKQESGECRHALVATLEKHSSGVNALALSRDGVVLYSGASDRSIRVWKRTNEDAGGGMEVVGALRGHSKAVLCLAIVSELVCSGSADKTVRIWREGGESYSCLAVLEGHKGPIKCITGASDDRSSNASDDGMSTHHLYSASLDCEIKVWEISVPIS